MTFDSLGGAHKPVERILGKWLQFEAKDKKKVDYRLSDAKYKEARVSYRDAHLLAVAILIGPGTVSA